MEEIEKTVTFWDLRKEKNEEKQGLWKREMSCEISGGTFE